jgi:hypothetical protein
MRKFAVGILVALVAGTMSLPSTAGASAPARCSPNESPAWSFTGSFDTSLEGAYVLVPFRVPRGTTKVAMHLCYDQPPSPTSAQIKHTLDLGLYQTTRDGRFDEDEFRGWGGSSRPRVEVTPEDSTVGFLPGGIPAGEWAAEIGVAAVAGPEEGDPDGSVGWRLEVFLGDDPDDASSPWAPTRYDSRPVRNKASWYRGDFHVHAEHSSPNDASMRETFDYAFGKDAAGLDFITLSDYVTSRHWGEIGRYQRRYPGKLIVRSAEVITYRGHINNHASAQYVDYRTGPIFEWRFGELAPVRDAQPASRIFRDIHNAGGFTQVNHPTTFPADIPGFGNICRGCSWEYSDDETDWKSVDAFEVQTGPAGTPEPQDHELGPNPFAPLAVRWWDELRAAGHRITAVGSSDSHHAGESENPVTQSPIGEATTVVYARELSERGIQRAVEAGHAYVKFFSPDGPDLRLTASAGKAKAMMGDLISADAMTLNLRVLNAAPSPEPRELLLMKDGVPMLALPVTSADLTFQIGVEDPGDYRLQLHRGTALEALTNPITLKAPSDQGSLTARQGRLP